jgi:hypothetical protein
MQGLYLVALTSCAGANVVVDDAAIMVDGELSPKALQRLLDTFMCPCMG